MLLFQAIIPGKIIEVHQWHFLSILLSADLHKTVISHLQIIQAKKTFHKYDRKFWIYSSELSYINRSHTSFRLHSYHQACDNDTNPIYFIIRNPISLSWSHHTSSSILIPMIFHFVLVFVFHTMFQQCNALLSKRDVHNFCFCTESLIIICSRV